MSEAQDARKRNKRRYGGGGPRNKRYKGSRELEVGMQGILITCNMNERKCTSEAFNLLNEYADKLYGPENFGDLEESNSEEEEEEEDDMEEALKKEVTQLRASSEKRQRRFQALDSGANNVIFIQTKNLDPDKLVHHILEDLHTTKKKKSRVILRMLPVSGTCKAFPEDMEKYLSNFLEPWFKTPNHGSYQIVFKARNSSHNKRDEVIKALAALVGKLNPKNKVDLTSPELTVIVEVIKSVCCVSVVHDYTLFRKFNLQEVVKSEANQSQDKQEVVKSEANQSQDKQEVVKSEADQSQDKQEVVKSEANQSQDKQEVEKSTASQSQGKQEVVKSAASQSQEKQEVVKRTANQSQDKQEVVNSVTSHSQEKQEVEKSSANQRREKQDVEKSAANQSRDKQEVEKSAANEEQGQKAAVPEGAQTGTAGRDGAMLAQGNRGEEEERPNYTAEQRE